ncbi:PRA1 family protein 2-like [Tubulanus polymorphus]|uniref:PRA1 family protein 2-like n=1 Tax=Tubulanus polymorphus TaxID=672921 RepID=UPI003DA43037
MAEIEIAPLRSLDDYLLESARFQVPNVRNVERWVNRVLNNLLYYQTNYMLTACIIFIIIGILNPAQMAIGIIATVIAFGIFVYATENKYELRRMKRSHPAMSLVVVLTLGYIFVYIVGSVLVFLLGIALPLAVILIHASLRMRNVRNKISNRIEFVGVKRTPMGLLLELLGQEQEAGS